MVNLLFNYLLESSVCLLLFAATYKLFISNLTHFTWNRFYLLASLILSLVLPFIIIPIQWSTKIISTAPFTNPLLSQAKQTVAQVVETNTQAIQINSGPSSLQIILYSAFAIYFIGVMYKSFLFSKRLSIR